MNDAIFKLKGKLQHYAWGGYHFIPNLLRIKNTEHQPCAEYWLGTHHSAPSVIEEKNISLQEWIEQNPEKILGENVYHQFQGLPYLFKVLDVKEMLSIQVHPTKEEAIKGFEKETAAGVLINAPNRNYKDKNHKPEVMIALSEFWLLHGFKSNTAIEKTLEEYIELSVFLPLFKSEGYKSLYKLFMEISQEEVDTILIPLVQKSISKKEKNTITKFNPEWWIAKLYADKNNLKNIDRGVFSIFLFNILQLQKGEAIFQSAGVPHAYLEGQNVELMANSDNVLRGGLTPKHVDVPELMKHILFESKEPAFIFPEKFGNEKIYNCPVDDFSISSITLQAGEKYCAQTTSLEILLITEGAIIIEGMENKVFKQGDAFAIIANTEYCFIATGNAVLYKAFVPFKN